MLRHNTAEVIGVANNLNTHALNASAMHSTNSSGNGGSTPGSALDALPKQFVLSMKTLFDILDDQQTGFVKLVDIEKGWEDDGCKGLPYGVIDSLRKVTPASGLLSFERFCAGLKLCLLRNQSEATHAKSNCTSTFNGNKVKSPKKPPVRPPSAPTLALEDKGTNLTWNSSAPPKNVAPIPPAMATVHPRNITHTQRAISMPQLSPDSELETEFANISSLSLYNATLPPPKPPRAAAVAAAANGTSATNTLDKNEIRHALQNWQMGILLSEMDAKDNRPPTYNMRTHFDYRGSADGGSSSATDSVNDGTKANLHVKKSTSKRREPRRHTLQNGIDYNMLRRLKQFEEEREVLLLGLNAVEKARDWYLKQIVNVQEKIKYLGRIGSHVEPWSEVHQERLNFQRARVLEVNRNLETLVNMWESGGFPMHFNLAIHTNANKPIAADHRATAPSTTLPGVERLCQQNRKLVNEVKLKNDRITLLEREKQTLMTQLYDIQQRIGINNLSNSFVNVLSQPSPICSLSSGGLGDADVVF